MNRRNIKQSLAAAALALAVLLPVSCTNDDPFGQQPEGSIPLELGEVTVAGMKTATRTAITEDAQGFTGVRKSRFVNGNQLELLVNNNDGNIGTAHAVGLRNGAWVFDAGKVFIIPGTTTFEANYTPTSNPASMPFLDKLSADTYTLSGGKLTLNMKHVNALIDITRPAGISPTEIKVTIHSGETDQTLPTAEEEEADGTVHYRTIAPPGTLKSITATVNGMTYVATFATPLTLQGNKRYPVALSFKADALTAAVGNSELNWGVGGSADMGPEGYTRSIGTPEDLAQFAADVNADVAGTGARIATVMQTADIDLSKLKPLAEAQAAHPDKGYSYTATADNWVPIGSASAIFNGKYNGNGYTISNLKYTRTDANGDGLFQNTENALLTSIHLYNVSLASGHAALVRFPNNSTIALCSATGSVTSVGDTETTGGLVGEVRGTCHITRCNADVTVTSANGNAGGLIGGVAAEATLYLGGCMTTGDVTGNGTGNIGGLIGQVGRGEIIGCMATGNVTGGTNGGALIASGIPGLKVISCYATGTCTGGFGPTNPTRYFACAYTGTVGSKPVDGVTGNKTAGEFYNIIVSGNEKTAKLFKTLHWSKVHGYTLYEVNKLWRAAGIWKDNGTTIPTVNMDYEGAPIPTPIVATNKVHFVNGYWVTAPDADESKEYQWAALTDAASMDNDPCAGHGSWRMPTMKDFEVMAGWTESNPWSQDVTTSITNIGSDQAIWNRVFPGGAYWSSVARTTDTNAWFMNSFGNGRSCYNSNLKTNPYWVRCVQER